MRGLHGKSEAAGQRKASVLPQRHPWSWRLGAHLPFRCACRTDASRRAVSAPLRERSRAWSRRRANDKRRRPLAIHPVAHAGPRNFSARAPWAATKVGRNGTPNPAGAGGGSSSSSLELVDGPTLLNHLVITLRLRGDGDGRLRSSLGTGVRSSSKASARMIASTSTTAPLSRRRNAGAFSTARTSEIQDARTARFCDAVSFGSLTTSSGWP